MRGFTHGLGLGTRTRTLEFIKSLFDQSRVFSSLSLSLFESNFLRFRISQVCLNLNFFEISKSCRLLIISVFVCLIGWSYRAWDLSRKDPTFFITLHSNVGPCGAMQSSNCCFFVEQPCSSSISQSLYRLLVIFLAFLNLKVATFLVAYYVMKWSCREASFLGSFFMIKVLSFSGFFN